MADARVKYKASVEGDLTRLDPSASHRILKALAKDGHPSSALKSEFAGLFLQRVGDDRVIYAPTNDGYLVLRIAHRGEMY